MSQPQPPKPEISSNVEMEKLSARDFDGHTAFAMMSPEERLTWLSHAAQLVMESRHAKSKSDQV